MFHICKNNNITVTRGDSFALDIFVNVGTSFEPELYELRGEDKLYFGLMEPNQPFEFALVRKVYSAADFNQETGMVHMEFEPEMTEYLMPGTYYYMIKLQTEDGEVSTVISKTKFIILD